MSETAVTRPIVVNASPAPAQLTTLVRQIILIASGLATAYGATKLGTEIGVAAVVAGPIAGLISLILGQIHTRVAAQRQAVMADALPDTIATTK